jgi:hypothetical protein
VVRPDFIPHALEAVQHMERISLVDGLADPAKKPRVDVLVPDGEIVSVERPATGLGFSVALQIQGLMGNDPQTGASGAVVEFRGVARGETLATGGGVFYLAGAGESVASANVLTNAGGAVLPQAGRASPAPVKPAANTTSTDGALSDESLARILKVASAAKRHTVQRAAERPLPVGETVRTRLDGLSIKEVALEDSSKVFATWFEGRIDRNPMDLELGESTPILGRAVVANPKPQPNVADLTLSGLMFLQNSTETKREKTAQCVIKGLISSRFTTDGRTEVKSTDVEIPVRLVRQRGVANTLRITTPFPFTSNADATMDVNWDDAATVAIEILSKSDRTTTDIDLKLQQDPAVFETSDERHAVAQHGLDVLDAVLDEPTFRDGAERRLFPPADDASKAIVRAHREWVFFHRRHEKECAPPERRAVVEPRRYRAYVTVTTQQLVAQLRKALFENDQGALGRFSFHEVDLVEFEAGSATLRTSQIALLQAFNRVPHGTELIWSGVVNGEAAKSDPSSVVFARLKRVEAALSPVLDPVQKLVSEVLPGVPEPTLTAADAHGVIILVTAEAAATTLRAALVFSEGFDVSSQIKAAEVAFTDNKPEAAPILEFVQRLELPVRQLVLAAKVPDDAAAERLKNVAGIAGLNIPGRNVPQQVIVLTDELASGLPPELLDKVSEVIYFDAATPPAPPPQNLLGLLR